MIVFIDDRPIRVTGPKAAARLEQDPAYDPDHIIDARLEVLRPERVRGHVLVLNTTPTTIEKLVSLLNNHELIDMLSVTMVATDKKAVEEHFKSLYTIVKAAGGVVFKEDKFLLIHRRGKWDLPKGKLDDKEASRDAAVREVEEETGVRVALDERVCTTWHTYSMNGKWVLKRTKWYRMTCLDDAGMAPQAEEDIDQIEWVDRREGQRMLANSYSSVRYVVEEAFQVEEEGKKR